MNLLGPAIVRDLVTLIQRPEADPAVTVLVFTSADKDYFISHVDLNRVSEYRTQAGKLTGEPSLTLLFRYLSASHLVTIAQIHGRVRGADNEFVLACDMRFAARENSLWADRGRIRSDSRRWRSRLPRPPHRPWASRGSAAQCRRLRRSCGRTLRLDQPCGAC
jgi:1,4-dihydroxy-2-naphthoyl-CoA synthase